MHGMYIKQDAFQKENALNRQRKGSHFSMYLFSFQFRALKFTSISLDMVCFLLHQLSSFLFAYFVFQPGCPFSPYFQIDNPFHDLQSRPSFLLLRLRTHSSLSVKPTKSFYRCLLSLPVHCCKLIFTSS